jgi:hypothetical protein
VFDANPPRETPIAAGAKAISVKPVPELSVAVTVGVL